MDPPHCTDVHMDPYTRLPIPFEEEVNEFYYDNWMYKRERSNIFNSVLVRVLGRG